MTPVGPSNKKLALLLLSLLLLLLLPPGDKQVFDVAYELEFTDLDFRLLLPSWSSHMTGLMGGLLGDEPPDFVLLSVMAGSLAS